MPRPLARVRRGWAEQVLNLIEDENRRLFCEVMREAQPVRELPRGAAARRANEDSTDEPTREVRVRRLRLHCDRLSVAAQHRDESCAYERTLAGA